jgi:dienelactone hydrolase
MGCGASKEADVSKASPIVPKIPAADAGKAKPAAGDSTSVPHAGGKKTVGPSPRIGDGGPIPYAPLPGPAMKEIVGEKVGDILINIYYPEDIDSRNDMPLIVYQHGRGTTYHVYKTLFQRWVAMGYIVAFPYNENSAVMGEDPPWPSTALDESLDGVEMQLTIKSMSQRNADSSSVFNNKVDMKNVALAGHSMGGKSSICAGAQVGPSCLVLHSPSCSSEGSEVYNLSKEWIEDKFRGLSNDKTPILLLTSDEDVRRENVESLFDTPLLADCPRVYLQFSKEACAKVPPLPLLFAPSPAAATSCPLLFLCLAFALGTGLGKIWSSPAIRFTAD